MRTMINLLNIRELKERSDESLDNICRNLYFNPLAIRWFVQAFTGGRSVKQLTDKRRDLREVLAFCFDNLYEVLDDDYKKVVRVLSGISST